MLKNQVAIVTGSGLGIGRAIASRLADDGATVIVATRTANDGEATVQQIISSGGTAHLHLCDVGFSEQVKALVAATIEHFGRLDIVVHNAGYFPYCDIENLSDAELERIFAINTKACFWLTQAALPHLKRSPNPRILITSSVSGNHANAPGLTHYSSAKAGVTGFVRNLALDLAPFGITVNAVEPGFIKTERNSVPEMRAMVDATAAQIPMRRAGEAFDVAHLMGFLASPQAAYITGQSIVVDGGLTLGTVSTIGQSE